MPAAATANLPALLQPTAGGIARAAALLQSGEVVALPTETVYGLAANALNEQAVGKIFTIKGRPLLDPLIVHGLDVESLAGLAYFTPAALKLAEACWPGPLTLVLPKKTVVPDLVTAGRATVAVRAPAHPVMRAVLAACGLPLAAPSANPFGYISPTRAEHVRDSLGERAPWIVDGGPCALGLESTIVDVCDSTKPVRVLRLGMITPQALSHILGGAVSIAVNTTAQAEPAGLLAPGMLERHYSPRTPLSLLEQAGRPSEPLPGQRVAWVRLQRPAKGETAPAGVEVFWLSENGEIGQAARTLYDLLRRLDGGGYTHIWCEPAPDVGMGLALNDRLRRAAARTR